MAISEATWGARLNVELSAALAEIYREQHLHAPSETTTVHNGNVVVMVLRDVLSPAERMMVRDGSAEQVQRLRSGLREVLEGEMRAAVERLTGCAVITAFSGDQLDAAMEAHVFVLDQAI